MEFIEWSVSQQYNDIKVNEYYALFPSKHHVASRLDFLQIEFVSNSISSFQKNDGVEMKVHFHFISW